jgi:hypothetical protein
MQVKGVHKMSIVGTNEHRDRTIGNMMRFLKALTVTFPECTKCTQAAQDFESMVVGNITLEKMAVTEWIEAMAQPLPDTVEYASALERLIGRPGLVYHAVAYQDGDTLVRLNTIKLIAKLDLRTKWFHPEFLDHRGILLKYIDHITKCALEYAHVPGLQGQPAMPSFEDVTFEMERVTPKSALADSVHALGEMFGCPSVSVVQWNELVEVPMFPKLVMSRDPKAIDMLAVDMIADATGVFAKMSPETRDETWEMIINLTNFSVVSRAVPTRMRERVEQVAAQISAQVTNGTMSLDQFTPERMMEIGQAVLEGTTQEDLLEMASKMDTFMPLVQQMAESNSYLSAISKNAGGLLCSL